MESSERIHKALSHFTTIMNGSLLMAQTVPLELLILHIEGFLIGVESALTKEEFDMFYERVYKILLTATEEMYNGL